MALIEGFRVQNYRALRDVTLGKLSSQQGGAPLTPFTVVIGKNGVGKSTLFDAFGFVADCLSHDVEVACDMKQRGGYERLRSRGTREPMRFEIYYRECRYILYVRDCLISRLLQRAWTIKYSPSGLFRLLG